jgi:MoaA/NifB/PqqE/SkfB family radical SAM enzyme
MTNPIAPATKILRYPGVLAAVQSGANVWPLHVEIDLAGVCNAQCGHCRFGDRQDGALMPRDMAVGIIDELVTGGTLAVTFSGGGEPTCNPHFADIATYARHEGLAVGVYSNGILGDRLIRAAGVASWIYISLDADNPIDYARVKGISAFDRVCETVCNLERWAAMVGVGMLLTGGNWHRAAAMQRLGESLGADYVQFRPVAGLPSYEWIPAALAELERIGAMHSKDRFADLYDHWRGVYDRGYHVCRASQLSPCIGADGKVWACPNTRGFDGRMLGDVSDDSLETIFERREAVCVRDDCEPTCRHHALNRTLALVCEPQMHEVFI